jgi:hypothetical protein
MIPISRDGTTYGPYSEAQVRDFLASGNLVLEDVASREGDEESTF